MQGQPHSTAAENALAHSEALTHAILQAAVDAIISIDEHGIIHLVNRAAERLFGYSEAELIGRNVNLLMPSPHRDEHDAYIARYLETGEKRIIGIGREVIGLRKDGTTFPMDFSVAEARLGDRRIFAGIIRDISGRKQSEEALQKLVDELRVKNEEVRATTQQLWQAAKLASVGELAASIAHELNNPLATVCLRIESALARTPADDPRRKALEIIAQEAKRMGDLVSNLLQFCRRGREEVSTVDVRRELMQAVELIQHQFKKRQIEVVQELAADLPSIYADRQKLRQVFLNLLTNACDAMPKGGTLVLRGIPINSHDRMGVHIEITDTGVGIASEHLDRVLEPFFTTKEEGKGTGLGLAICKRIVIEHQGTLAIDSLHGKGTTVCVYLPIRTEANVAQLR